ncbi:hypothetical protein DFH27DRAFT_555010 [Peziza echinospora]|nr:hypothetical protein DFH27DRAFT_555010 [Peziza echinospora]
MCAACRKVGAWFLSFLHPPTSSYLLLAIGTADYFLSTTPRHLRDTGNLSIKLSLFLCLSPATASTFISTFFRRIHRLIPRG